MPVGRYVVPTSILAKYRAETIDILRLGAIANALNAITSSSATSLSRGVGRDRDALQAGLLVGSYLKEAIEILDQRRLWQLIDKAVAAGFVLPKPVEYYRQLFSRGKGSLYKRILVAWRNTKGFHVDSEHFNDWIQTVNAPEITIWQRDSDNIIDWAFTISLQIQSFYGKQPEGDWGFARELGNAPHLVFIVEALCAGLVVDDGFDFLSGWRPSGSIRVRIEYEFRDGRPAMCEERVADVEGQVLQLTGTAIHELRQHLAAQFGVLSEPKRTGYVLHPADGGLMLYSCRRGVARVSAGPRLPPPAASLPDDVALFIRMRNAGWLGEQQALKALKLAEAVRDGRATAEDAVTLTEGMCESLEYWQSVRKMGEEVAARRSVPPAECT